MKDTQLDIGLFCRSCGPGGTSISFYVTDEGIKAIWNNEELPYKFFDVTINDNYEASDGHNVDIISFEDFDKMVKLVNKKRGIR
jgi:hypothetical protein